MGWGEAVQPTGYIKWDGITERFCETCGKPILIGKGHRKPHLRNRFCSQECGHYMGRLVKKGLEARSHPSTIDIAWAAGIFEGEGCAYRTQTGGECCAVYQKDPWLFHRLGVA